MPLPSWPSRALASRAAQALLFAAALWPRALSAAEIGEVLSLTEDNGAGSFRGVSMSAGTVCMRNGVGTPLVPGFAIEDGDRLASQKARVQLALGDGVSILLSEGADLTVSQRRIEQAQGGAFYEVDAPFEVAAGKVLIAVEGTRFYVQGGDPVVVALDHGQVRVTGKDEPVLLGSGELVETNQGMIPGGVRPLSLAERKEIWGKTWLKGEAPLSAGLLAGGGYLGGFGPSARFWLAAQLPARLELLVDLGVALPVTRGGILAPGGAGLGFGLGPVTLGAEFLAGFDARSTECGGDYQAIHLGGVGLAQAGLPLGRKLSLVAALRGGYLGQPLADLGIGIGMGF